MGVPAPSPPYFCAPKSRIAGLRAALFDLDGTLYDQSSLRAAILLKLSIYVAGHPLSGWQTIRILRSYRKAQEWMRYQDQEFGDLAEAQLNLACQWSGADSRCVRKCIREWMGERPTQILMRYRMPFLVEFLEELKAGVSKPLCVPIIQRPPNSRRLEFCIVSTACIARRTPALSASSRIRGYSRWLCKRSASQRKRRCISGIAHKWMAQRPRAPA